MLVLAATLIAVGSSLGATAQKAPACNLVPQLRDVTINQGVGAYPVLVNGKETLVRFYLSMPSCAGSGASIQVKEGTTLTVSGGGTVDNPTPVPTSTAYPAIASFTAAPMTDSTGDPKFVVPAPMVSRSSAFTASFSMTLRYQSKPTRTGALTAGQITFSNRPGTTTPITASFDRPSNALGVLFVPMGDATKSYSSQWTAAGQQALQDGMTAAVARQYPLPAGTGSLGGTGGLRYSVTPTLLDLKALNLLDGNGKFCGTGANYDVIKGQLAQFRLSHNSANPNAQANRVVGVVDPAIGLGPPSPCFEGMAVVNSQEAWALAIAGRAGNLIGLELAHTLGLTPPSRESPFDGAHSQNTAAENPSVNRRYNTVQRSFITIDRSLLKPSATSPPPDNINTLLEVPDHAFLLCVFGGGTPNSECATYGPGTVSATAPVAATLSFVMSGTTDSSSTASICATCTGIASGTSVVESYFASTVPQTAPSPSSTYRLVQRGATGPLFDQGVPVSFFHSGHGGGDGNGTRSSGLFSFVLPFDPNASRIELWKGAPDSGLLIYARDRTTPPVVSSFSVGEAPIGYRPGPRSARILATFIVNTTADSGPGSLRQAILNANATPGADTITFTDTMTIAPTSALPTITEAVTIDGTQGSSTTPGVTLDGIGAGGVLGLRISAGGTTIRRLAIVRFDSGVFFDSGSGSALEASYVGIGADGVTDLGNANDGVFISSGASSTTIGPGNVISGNTREGIQIQGTGGTIVRGNLIGTNAAGTAAVSNGLRGILFNGSSGNTVGGAAPGAGNVISGNNNVGIIVNGASNNTIQGNRIGTNAAGTAAVPNGPGGIQLLGGSAPFGANGNTIGGTASGAGNLISGNTGPGILLNSSGASPSVTGNTIQGNLIGTDVTGNSSIPNSGVNGHGISIVNVGGISGNVIGAGGAASRNVIAYNSGDGISISSDTGNVRNTIRENEIHTNGGLGIDLGANGVTANDAGDGDTGANNLQNFPVLTSASGGVVQGGLSSAPNTQYVIELFSSAACDGSGNGEAARFLESFAVGTDPSGNTGFSASPPTLATGEYVTATATDASVAIGDTSELSPCLLVSGGGGGGAQPGPTFTVNTNTDVQPFADAGCTTSECTLREAISAANAASGANTIDFALPGSTQIAPTSGLPSITSPVDIDGTVPPEGIVTLNGDGAGTADGLVLASGSGGSTIERLRIRDFFGGAAIRIASANNTVAANKISAVLDGIVVAGTGASGNQIGGSDDAGRGNRIWNFSSHGVKLDTAGSGNEIAGNTIGLDEANVGSAGDVGVGVIGTPSTVIGDNVGPSELGIINYDLGNVIVDSQPSEGGGYGISLRSNGTTGTTGTIVAGNFVGTDRTRTATNLGNGTGIRVSGSSNNQLGPGNTVTQNGFSLTGIRVASGSGNRIVANSIYDNVGPGIGLNEGANGDLGAPALSSASLSGSTTTVRGSITAPNGTYFVEFFRNANCDSSGFGEGKTYIFDFASVTVTDGSEPFSKTLNGFALGDVVTTTLTSTTNSNTSEFSNCVTVENAPPPGQEPVFVQSTDDNPEDDTLDLYLDCGPSKPKQVIAVGLIPNNVTATTASWSTNYDSTLAPANCELQAIVMDGFSRSSFTALGTEPTTSGPNALVAAISSPREDATFLQYGLIPLRGSIRNAEAELTGATLEWKVDGPGTFTRSGTGTIVDLQPPNGGWPAGVYTATFSAPGGGSAATDIVNFTVLTDADNDGIAANVESQSCFGAGADNDPLNADDDSDGDGIPNANDPQPCVPATSYTAIVDFTPDPLPTGSTGTTVTVEVRVPGRNIAQVLASSVRITRIADEDVSTDSRFANIAWTIKSGVGIAKFDRQKLVQYLADRNIHNRVITITVAGRSGAPPWSFEGSDTTFVQG
ncbi:MAG: right-handed parallel beta-helix repeat-containing protein [Actinomycetota bacterium]|nr:right-handed parallel beta-helix repeat-containing protein [Actinomycetota bacterium]